MIIRRSIKPNIIIIGAGTVGLTMAYILKKKIDCNVVIVAEKYYSQTTSYGSGGYWMPYAVKDDNRINCWGRKSYDHFLSLSHSSDGNKTGIKLIQSIQLYEKQEDVPYVSWKDCVIGYRLLSTADIDRYLLPNNKYKAGYTFTTVVADQKYYMKYLMDEIQKDNVQLIQQRIKSINELISSDLIPFTTVAIETGSIIINCSGIEGDSILEHAPSNTLHDTKPSVHPTSTQPQHASLPNEMYCHSIRGQVLRVKAPWIQSVWGFGNSYIIPNIDNVVLGGTAQRHNYNYNPTLDDSNQIQANIIEMFPALKDAVLDNVWAGLRPGREKIRCGDSEIINGKLLVHCYGHGGSGITLAYGCALDVVENYVKPFIDK